MNAAGLLEVMQQMGQGNDLKLQLVNNKSQSNDFNVMFDKAMTKNVDDNVVKVDNKNNEVKTSNDINDNSKIKNDNENKTEVKVENKNEKIEASDEKENVINVEEKNEDDEKIQEKVVEVFSEILNLFQNGTLDLKDYFNVKEDGTFEINELNLPKLKVEIQNYFDLNNIDINVEDLKLDNLDFDKILNVSLNFILDDANKQVKFENVFLKDNNKDFIVLNPNEDDNLVATNNEIISNNIEENVDVNNEDNFEILKQTINEMVDEVKVVSEKEINDDMKNIDTTETEFIQDENFEVKKEIKNDDEVINKKIDETTLEIKEEVKDDVVNKTLDEEKLDIDKKEFTKTDKKENKDVKRIKIENNTNEFSLNIDNDIDNNFDLKEVIKDNLPSQSVTDRYLETINVAKQMVKGIEVKLSENVQEMHIKLDPENLGKVNLRIVTENGLVQAKFEAENQKVKEIIESNLSLLKESLEKRGVEVSNIDVSVGQNMNQNNNQTDIEYMRKILREKNPHKIIGKTLKNFISSAEIENSELKKHGLFMTRSKVNYIA